MIRKAFILGIATVGMSAPAGAAVIPINLTGAGSNSIDITGLNAGLGTDFPGGTKTANNFFPTVGSGDLGLTYQPFTENWSGFILSNGLKLAITGGDVSARSYSPNELINSTATWSDTVSETLLNYFPDFPEIKRGNIGDEEYLGFQSIVGPDTYYGWMQINWNNSAGFGGVFEILSAAYESTPNTPIQAGSFSSPSTPVPGPLPLFGVAGAYAYSRRLRARIRQRSSTSA